MVAGRRLCRVLLGRSAGDALALEISAFGAAFGFGLLAYGVMLLGLFRELHAGPILGLLALMAIAGWTEHAATARELAAGLRTVRVGGVGWAILVAFAFFSAVAVVGCLTPPTSMEWDSLAYHLADPKIYLRYGRILYLPWESHSNFAFTMEMLYTVGLSMGSVALAKAFHLAMGAIAVLAIYLIGVRHMSALAGKLAALLFASLPIVFWEAGTAYVDLAAVAYGALALLALLNGLNRDGRRWLWVCAVALGWMVGVKATSAITLVLIAIWIAVAIYRSENAIGQAIRWAVVVGIVAAVIGSPWYIKSAVYTGNPVYPFAYSIFGGKYWSASNAAAYNQAQQEFGVRRHVAGAKAPLQLSDLLLAPWNLVMYSMPGHAAPVAPGEPAGDGYLNPFNDFPSAYFALSPFLLAALFAGAFAASKMSRASIGLGVFSVASLVIWFFLTQQVRYLLPVLAPACLVTVDGMCALLRERKASGYTLAIVFAVSVLGSMAIGAARLNTTLPVATGEITKADYIGHGLNSYGAMQFLNGLPHGSRVIFYGEPRGFYCDQPYMLGDSGPDPQFPPYGQLGSPQALLAYFKAHGIRYILINAQNFQPAAGSRMGGMVTGLLQLPGAAKPVYASPGGLVAVYKIN